MIQGWDLPSQALPGKPSDHSCRSGCPRPAILRPGPGTAAALTTNGNLRMTCLACAVDADKSVQAYRKGSKQLVVFDDVDVGFMIELKKDEKRVLTGHVIRAGFDPHGAFDCHINATFLEHHMQMANRNRVVKSHSHQRKPSNVMKTRLLRKNACKVSSIKLGDDSIPGQLLYNKHGIRPPTSG